jgi:hypothetical protein
MSAISIGQLVARSRRVGIYDRRSRGRFRRVVVRIDSETIERIDRLAPGFDDASRAAVIRGFVALGLAMAEEQAPLVVVETAEEIDAPRLITDPLDL